MLEVHPAEEDLEEFLEALDIVPIEEELPEECITMYSMNGLPVYSTFKIAGTVKGKSVLILLDPGNTHNIVSNDLVERLRCDTIEVPEFKVSLADGKQVKGKWQCKDLEWSEGGQQFRVDALVLPLYDYDMVLGMQWLESSEKMTWDFK